jgi:hypothetical protein
MVHATLGTLLLVLSTGCATGLFAHRERVNNGQEVMTGAARAAMEPTIRPAKGAGVVLGLSMAFDLGPKTSAAKQRDDAKSKSVLALMGGRLNPIVQPAKPLVVRSGTSF